MYIPVTIKEPSACVDFHIVLVIIDLCVQHAVEKLKCLCKNIIKSAGNCINIRLEISLFQQFVQVLASEQPATSLQNHTGIFRIARMDALQKTFKGVHKVWFDIFLPQMFSFIPLHLHKFAHNTEFVSQTDPNRS